MIRFLKHFKKKWIWLIPILLFISSFGWTTSFFDQPERKISPELLFLCRITGILCSLLLGYWWIRIFTAKNFWGKASVGVFGICFAGFILQSFVKLNLYVYYVCAVIQVLWLIFIFSYKSKDEKILERIEFQENLDEKLRHLLGGCFLRCSNLIKKAMGFLCFLCLGFFGWALLSIGATIAEANSEFIWKGIERFKLLMKGAGLSLALFLMFVTYWGPAKDSLRIFILGKSTFSKVLTHTILPNYLFGVFLSIPSIFIIGSITKRFFITGALVIFLFTIFSCVLVCFLRQVYRRQAELEKSIERGESQDSVIKSAREFIFKNCRKFISYDENGLNLCNIGGKLVYKWDAIKNIFLGVRCLLYIVNDQGKQDLGSTQYKGWSRGACKWIEGIWQKWYKHIVHKEQIAEFSYPQECQDSDHRKNVTERWLIFSCGIFSIVMTILFLIYHEVGENLREQIFMYVFYVLFSFGGIACLIVGILSFIKKPKILSKISLEGNNIVVWHTDNTKSVIDEGDVLKCSFMPGSNGFSLYSKQSGNINHLERVNYFPVLRERLIEIAERNRKS